MAENEKMMKVVLQMQQQLSDLNQHMINMGQRMLGIEQRMENIEQTTSAIQHDVTKVQHDVVKVRTIQENTVVPHIKLLAEGYGSLQEKLDHLADVSPIPDMQDDIDIMQKAITSIAQAK